MKGKLFYILLAALCASACGVKQAVPQDESANGFLPGLFIVDEPGTQIRFARGNVREKAIYDWSTAKETATRSGRLLSSSEWTYILRYRANAELLFGLGRVAGMNGMILLPYGWQQPEEVPVFKSSCSQGLVWQPEYRYYENEKRDNFEHNTYTAREWEKMEQAGAVFLPAAGAKDHERRYDVNAAGYYWSSTPDDEDNAFYMSFSDKYVFPVGTDYKTLKYSARLVWVEE